MRLGRRHAMLGGALVLGGCGKAAKEREDAGAAPSGPPDGSLGDADAGLGPSTACDRDAAGTVFDAEQRTHARPAASVFYSWTTAEQVAEIKQSKQLFTRTERPGLGPGYAMDVFAQRANDYDDNGRIAGVLAGDTFAKGRYAWTAAWATRMGWPGESYGNELLRIELRPEAWILSFTHRQFAAFDLANNAIPLKAVLAAPERIGAIYFVQDEIYEPCGVDAGPRYGTFVGSFARQCLTAGGYREYILGSDAMVASFSHGTDETRAEVARGIALLQLYRQRTAWTASSGYTAALWNKEVVEAWSRLQSNPDCRISENSVYENSLAIPSTLYEPSQENLAAIIATLEGDPVPAEPFVVRR